MPIRNILSLLVCSVCVSLSACSQLIPGLNIRAGSQGQHEYNIVSDEERGGYEVSATGTKLSYMVTPITPGLLESLADKGFSQFTYTLPSILPSDVPPEYRIGPGDIVYVTVWDHPELTSPYVGTTTDSNIPALQGRVVAADGTMFYPYVGVFKAAGMTSGDLREFLTSKLARVITSPQVDVRTVAFRASRVEVTGEVEKPGTITLDDTPKGILQAISASGGLAPGASRRRAILVRQGRSYQIDLAGLLSGSRPVKNPKLEPGDVLHIPDQSGDQIFVLGAVTKQEPMAIQQNSMTLIQAISQAGGLDVLRGSQSGVIVFRPNSAQGARMTANVYTLDLSNPKGVLLASQFDLEPRDVVYVSETAFAQYNSIISQLLPTVTTIFELHQLTK